MVCNRARSCNLSFSRAHAKLCFLLFAATPRHSCSDLDALSTEFSMLFLDRPCVSATPTCVLYIHMSSFHSFRFSIQFVQCYYKIESFRLRVSAKRKSTLCICLRICICNVVMSRLKFLSHFNICDPIRCTFRQRNNSD